MYANMCIYSQVKLLLLAAFELVTYRLFYGLRLQSICHSAGSEYVMKLGAIHLASGSEEDYILYM